MKLKVLIGCEHSGVVRQAFRQRGHAAWSCDLLPASDGSRFHIRRDVLTVLDVGWDLAIFHPDCTFLTSSAEWAYGDPPFPGKTMRPGTLTGEARRAARREAVGFVKALLAAPIARIALENPVGHLSRAVGPPTQIIQPHQYGHDASKRTCLWLKGLPKLKPTNQVAPRIANGLERWANQTDTGQNRLPPSEDRWMLRARTYPGIAKAFATQWG
jgi:hypothetical protein